MSNEEKTQNSGEGVPSSEGKDKLFRTGSILTKNSRESFYCISIIGQVEGHYILEGNQKATRYDHLIPLLVSLEESDDVDGVLIVLNTMGGDVEAGLALAELISTMSKPTVSLVLGGSHSIGVPLAVSTDYSFIVPSGTMVIHPVRMNGMVIGAQQTYDYFKQMQNRILHFIATHSNAKEDRLEELMMYTGMLTKDLGTILVGEEAVKEGLIEEVGGIHQAFEKLHELIDVWKISHTKSSGK